MEINEDYSKEILKQNERILVLILVFFILIALFLFSFSHKKDKEETKLYLDDICDTREIGKLNKIVKQIDNVYLDIEYPSIGYKEIDKKIYNIVEDKMNYIKDTYVGKENAYYYFLQYEIYVGNGNIASLYIKDRVDDNSLKNIDNKKEIYYFSLDKKDMINSNDIFKDGYEDKKEELGIDSNLFYLKNDKIVYVLDDKEIELEEIKDYLNIDINVDKNYSNDIESKKITIINRELKAIQDVIVYDVDSLSGNILMTIKKDTLVKVHSNYSNGFSMVFCDKGIGYLETKYLEEVTDDNKVINTDRENLYVLEQTNVRSDIDLKSSVIGQLNEEDVVVKTGEIGDLIRIDYNGVDGFIKRVCVSRKKLVRKPVDIDVINQGEIDPDKPMVAITFDDGPNDKSTVRILDVLEKYNVKATFFDLGSLMLKYPDVVKREASLGEVGTHTYNHYNLNKLSEEQLVEELKISVETYKTVLGEEPKLIRTPYGNANGMVRSYITNMALINWSVDSLDWKYRNKDMTLKEIDKYGDLNGKIVLMHSIHGPTADAFEELVPKLLEKGYQLVTISELAYYKNYTLETGVVFYHFK